MFNSLTFTKFVLRAVLCIFMSWKTPECEWHHFGCAFSCSTRAVPQSCLDSLLMSFPLFSHQLSYSPSHSFLLVIIFVFIQLFFFYPPHPSLGLSVEWSPMPMRMGGGGSSAIPIGSSSWSQDGPSSSRRAFTAHILTTIVLYLYSEHKDNTRDECHLRCCVE